MRSKAWLAARVPLRLARLPRTASSAQRSGSHVTGAPRLRQRQSFERTLLSQEKNGRIITVGSLSFGLIEENIMFSVTSECARRPGAASQAFERMHSTLSHGSKT
jgi:hypothetical protein